MNKIQETVTYVTQIQVNLWQLGHSNTTDSHSGMHSVRQVIEVTSPFHQLCHACVRQCVRQWVRHTRARCRIDHSKLVAMAMEGWVAGWMKLDMNNSSMNSAMNHEPALNTFCGHEKSGGYPY